MSQTERDQSLVRFAAEEVMGWHAEAFLDWAWRDSDDHNQADASWNPLDSWSDVGQLWEKVVADGYAASLWGSPTGWVAGVNKPGTLVESGSGPRVLTKAVCRAFGWKED